MHCHLLCQFFFSTTKDEQHLDVHSSRLALLMNDSLFWIRKFKPFLLNDVISGKKNTL